LRIGFIGNTVNYPFTLAAALVKRGVDVRMLLIDPEEQMRPSPEAILRHSGREGWVYDVAPLRTWDVILPTVQRRRALRLLRDCDAIVANSWGIALAATIDRPLFVISTGSDLDTLANPDYLHEIGAEGASGLLARARRTAKRWLYRRLVPLQREGFCRAVGVEYAWPGVLPHGDALLAGMGISADRRYCFSLTDLDELARQPQSDNTPLQLLGIARVNWKLPLWAGASVLDNKRTDLLLRGVARHYERTGHAIDLRLFRKGRHIAETERLAEELGIASQLTWLEQGSREMFRAAVIAADVVADHFGEGTMGTGGRDAFALGRPVLAGGDVNAFMTSVGEPLPVVHATNAESIADAIERLKDPAERNTVADRARSYAERHFSADTAADTVLNLFLAARR
jgi:glycosyltransferase involved in cell wall biosynthesis